MRNAQCGIRPVRLRCTAELRAGCAGLAVGAGRAAAPHPTGSDARATAGRHARWKPRPVEQLPRVPQPGVGPGWEGVGRGPKAVSDRVGRGLDGIKPVSDGLERGDGVATRWERSHKPFGNQHTGQPWQGRCGCVRATSGRVLLACGATIHVSPARGRTRRRCLPEPNQPASRTLLRPPMHQESSLSTETRLLPRRGGSVWEGWEWTVTDGRGGPAGPASGRSKGSPAEQQSPRPGSTASGYGGQVAAGFLGWRSAISRYSPRNTPRDCGYPCARGGGRHRSPLATPWKSMRLDWHGI